MKRSFYAAAAILLIAAVGLTAFAALAEDEFVTRMPLTRDTIPAPQIEGLYMLDEELEENPIIQFHLHIPVELARDIEAIENAGGSVTIRAEARIAGEEEWEVLWISQNGAHEGDIRGYVVSIAEDGEIIQREKNLELRCCFCVEQYDPTGEFVLSFDSDYSSTMTVNKDTVPPEPTTPEPEAEPTSAVPEKETKSAGKRIGLYAAIAVVEIAAVAAIVLLIRKKRG